MTRGTLTGLPSAHPLGHLLPGVYHDDELTQRWTAGLDDVLAPVFLVLDCLDAYVDPSLAPPDFLTWLASWVGVELDETWSLERQRDVVVHAVALQHCRGTARALLEHIRLTTGFEVQIRENGGARWSTEPGTAPPGQDGLQLLVHVRITELATADRTRLEAAVREARPAHVPYQIKVTPPSAEQPTEHHM